MFWIILKAAVLDNQVNKINFPLFLALSESERELWMEGLDHLVKKTRSDSYITQLLKLLHTEFITMENKNNL